VNSIRPYPPSRHLQIPKPQILNLPKKTLREGEVNNAIIIVLHKDSDPGMVDVECEAAPPPRGFKGIWSNGSIASELKASLREGNTGAGEHIVCVYNSYDVKDLCRLSGFRWNVERRAWTMTLDSLSSSLDVPPWDVNASSVRNHLLSFSSMPPQQQEPSTSRGIQVSFEYERGELVCCVSNSYSIKDDLKRSGFRCAPVPHASFVEEH
jgi:hypothetical protein